MLKKTSRYTSLFSQLYLRVPADLNVEDDLLVALALQVAGLFKCPETGLIFNADLVGAFNILKKAVKTITPNLPGLTAGRGNWPKTRPEGFREPLKGFPMGTPQTFPSLARELSRTLAVHGGKEVRRLS
ncbi:putative transposase [Thermococcus sp. 2319x1]|uniref:hypothetical protein n=1 Tax=Thermococcus sp. 2319x1 TaxID=1674923 RepID=UPI00073A70A8|nr:putative transposase [Thermococcus sp. 2319x1]